jgi:hypothetical protein
VRVRVYLPAARGPGVLMVWLVPHLPQASPHCAHVC